jgi:hypothetical protein
MLRFPKEKEGPDSTILIFPKQQRAKKKKKSTRKLIQKPKIE